MIDALSAGAWLEREDTSRVPVTDSCTIGRAPANQLVLTDEKASRKHALIHRQGENEYWLVDLGSSNGSYLDGRRVSQPVALQDGAVIRIGSSTLVFRMRAPSTGSNDSAGWNMQTIQDIRVGPSWLMLADIEGSTELSLALPADDLPVVMGRWFSECKQLIETRGGSINKYLGDGFFAYWPDSASSPTALVRALCELKLLQAAGTPRFRVVLHHGFVAMGGAPSMGEESLSGPEVNFVFRMEKLAGSLGHADMMSAAAQAKLADLLPAAPAGQHAVPGFEGNFDFWVF